MAMLPVPMSNSVVPSGTRVNFLSVLVMLGVTAVGGAGLLLAGSVGALVGAIVLGLLLGMARRWRSSGSAPSCCGWDGSSGCVGPACSGESPSSTA